MGKEWLYWGSSGSGTSNRSTHRRRGSRGEEVVLNNNEEAPPPAGCMCFQIFDLPHFQLALNQQSRSFKPHSTSSDFLQQEQKPSFLKAPRNSLDLEEPVVERKSVSSSLSSSTMKIDDQNLNIPVGIQIRTSCDSRSSRVSTSTSRTRTDDISSECSSTSPAGTKTPTLVARLMGLDLLPENNSPRISLSTCNSNNPPPKSKNVVNNQSHGGQSNSKNRRLSNFESSDNGTLSLPETPRISSASRRSDVDHYHHRLSLQINKENNMGDVFEHSAYSTASRNMARNRRMSSYENIENYNRSPGYYARQIVKQVKESVSRKVGHDITNTSFRRKDDQLATAKYDDQVVLLKPKKQTSKVLAKLHGDDHDFSPSKQTTPCSPRFRFLEPKSSKPVNSSTAKSQTSHSPRFSPLSPLPENPTTLPAKIVTKPKTQSSQQEQVKQKRHLEQNAIQKGKGDKCRSSAHPKKPPQACDAIRSKKEEPFVRSAAATNKDKKCKKTSLSNQLVNNSVPTILPLKKDPSPPPTKLLIKQSQQQESDTHPSKRNTQLSSSSSHRYKHYKLTTKFQEMNRDTCNGATISGDGAEFQYIQRILKRTGIDKSTPLSLAKWYSHSHPLDPSIFHHFELFHLPITTSIFTTPNSTLTLRCNRKLIFQLVDELLVDILKPYFSFKSMQRCRMNGKELIDTLCMRIRSFPSANCQVLEDIDALIDKDLEKTELGIASDPFQEQVESIVSEIERDIIEELMHETAYKVTV
ncbi:uncharacterized protein LOC107825904 isoform X2 [Nicotiana tabacum]|uniref:Uncharacterized protein LOC107825904 isoform X2 n=1 Tax=Nicotiana tabacum TaxID=4097 RepID=A0AC58UPH6_TOBAC